MWKDCYKYVLTSSPCLDIEISYKSMCEVLLCSMINRICLMFCWDRENECIILGNQDNLPSESKCGIKNNSNLDFLCSLVRQVHCKWPHTCHESCIVALLYLFICFGKESFSLPVCFWCTRTLIVDFWVKHSTQKSGIKLQCWVYNFKIPLWAFIFLWILYIRNFIFDVISAVQKHHALWKARRRN